MKATVVIPTHNRVAGLARCLAALERQTVPVEVIVVHDGDEGVAEVDALAERVVRQPRGGVASARNQGVRHATTDIVLLLDDDCEPEADWAEQMCKAFDDGATVVAGAVVNPLPHDPYASATQAIHYHLMEAPGSAFATGNNIGARRSVWEAIPFDESYKSAGEDRDWCVRVERAGYVLTRAPDARVLHWQELNARSFVRKHYQYGESSAYFRAHTDTRRYGIGFYTGAMRRGFRISVRTGLLVGVAQAAAAIGALRHAAIAPR